MPVLPGKKDMGKLNKSTQQNMTHDNYMRLAMAMAQKVPRYPFVAVIVRRATGRYRQSFDRLPEVTLTTSSRGMKTIQEFYWLVDERTQRVVSWKTEDPQAMKDGPLP
ncbi:hypothetical protein [Candidatus Nitrospira neomarina]|uniref:Uncharacterized protein n=1 Tax=Candidatus Nitrospira neomarina TaxID=3020899 RepID=A0AA96GJ37_9BACT|nr:hypothetical protein [Candidatus Nitrospira neomarina]WNM63369.1 hypothetical protein PQG83_06330 [Candidatus Nitrospira neomarina]